MSNENISLVGGNRTSYGVEGDEDGEGGLNGGFLGLRQPRRQILAFILVFLVLVGLIFVGIAIADSAKQHPVASDDEGKQPSDGPGSNPTPTPAPWRCTPTPKPTVTYKAHTPVLLQGGTVWDGLGNVLTNTDVLLENGRITQMGQGITAPAGATVVNVAGRIVTPGLVDMHSHVGLDEFPAGRAHENTNELTIAGAIQPQLRAIDAFDPEDQGVADILSGGVTTSQVIPGSGNIMGGQGMMIKMRRGVHMEDVLIADAPPLLKMACGENPMRVYESLGYRMPSTRLGIGWLMRQELARAQKLQRAQAKWCASADDSDKPEDLALQPLVDMLNGYAVLNVHCYEVNDLQMMLRMMDEFQFNVTAFHHGLEAWKIADKIARAGVGVSTFADLWGYKMEAYDGSTRAPKILVDAGVKTALKSDHPVLNAKELLYEAQKAHYYGLGAQDAFRAVTSVPATLMRLNHRVGSVGVGMDADVVVWDRNPLRVGATPDRVYVEGQLMVNNQLAAENMANPDTNPAGLTTTPTTACSDSNTPGTYVVEASSVYTMQAGASAPLANQRIVVTDGVITCMGTTAACAAPNGAPVYTTTGGVVTPGLITSGTILGQSKVDAESTTHDGTVGGSYGSNALNADVRARDGVRWINSRHVRSAWQMGVTGVVSYPMSDALVRGQSVAWLTLGETDLSVIEDVSVRDSVALHVTLGNPAKQGGHTNSVSGQMALLRALLTNATQGSIFAKAATGALPLVVHAHQADDCGAVATLARTFPNANVVLFGAAEAYRAVRALNQTGVKVVVSPARAIPEHFDTARATPASPKLLQDGGITGVAIGSRESETVRQLRWDAALSGLYDRQGSTGAWNALAAVTSRVADAFALSDTGMGRVQVGDKANFVLWTGLPMEVDARVRVVAIGKRVECNPVEY